MAKNAQVLDSHGDPIERVEGEEEFDDEEQELDDEQQGDDEEHDDDDDDDDETLTVEELQERLAQSEKERDGYRRDMFRMRERARVARQRRQMESMYDPPAGDGDDQAGGDDDGDDRITVELDDDGNLSFDRKQLLRDTQRATRGRTQQQLPPQQQAAAQAVANATMNYQRTRSALIEEADDPITVADRLDELEMSYQYLDRMVGQTITETGVAPQGEPGLVELIETEGLDRRFSRRFPGIDWKKLIHAPNDPYALRELVKGPDGKGQRDRDDQDDGDGERRERRLRSGDRPRTMRRGRRRANPKATEQQFQELSPEELLKLTDEEVEEYERNMR